MLSFLQALRVARGHIAASGVIAGARDVVDHPAHYNSHPAGIECIDVVEHLSFNVGNAIKYLWRAGLKSSDAETDLAKAAWYIERERQRLGGRS